MATFPAIIDGPYYTTQLDKNETHLDFSPCLDSTGIFFLDHRALHKHFRRMVMPHFFERNSVASTYGNKIKNVINVFDKMITCIPIRGERSLNTDLDPVCCTWNHGIKNPPDCEIQLRTDSLTIAFGVELTFGCIQTQPNISPRWKTSKTHMTATTELPPILMNQK